MTTTATPAAAKPKSLWTHRDYQLLMSGRTLAVIGGSMTGLAMMLLATDLSHDAAQAAGVMGLFVLGEVIVGLPAGALVDRWNRKRVMVVASLLAALVLATVPACMLLGWESVPHLAVVAFLIGGLGSFYAPAETAALKHVVPASQLGDAMAATQARQALGAVAGPPLAGVLYGLSRFLPMVGDAVANLIAAACAAGVRADLTPTRDESDEAAEHHLLREIGEGLRWMFRHPVVRPITVVACLINLAFAIVQTATVIAMKLGGASDAAIGTFEGVLGAAMLAGALLASQILRLARVGVLFVAIQAAIVAVAAAIVFVRDVWGLTALFAVLCFVMPALNSGLMAYFMHIVPDRLVGRTGAAAGTMVMGLMPVGNLIAGLLLQHAGRTWALLPGIAILLVALVVGAASRAIRSIPKTRDFAPEKGDATAASEAEAA